MFSSSPRTDIITLQNPHGFPQVSIPKTNTSSGAPKPKENSAKPATAPSPAVTAIKSKEPVPCKQAVYFHPPIIYESQGTSLHIQVAWRVRR
jgi:hypothetical protein